MRRAAGRRRRRQLALLLWSRLSRFGALFLAVVLVATTLVWLFERSQPRTNVHTWFDALWLSLQTLSTVGYGDVVPVSSGGRVVTSALIVFTLLTVGFLLAALNESVLEVKQMDEKGLLGTDLRGHVLVYGFSPVAQTAIEQLLGAERAVALVCEHVDQIAEARDLGDEQALFITAGELTRDLLVGRVNVHQASTAVVASDDDARNIIAALNVRAVNPDLRIIVAVRAPELRQTLIASGVTYVSSPFELSGRLVASAAFEPEVAKLVEDISSSGGAGYDLQQFSASVFAGQTIADIRRQLDEIDGPLLMARCAAAGDDYEVLPHPSASQVLDAEDYIIVLCNEDQAERMTSRWNLRQGR
jgi:voltage-gated potassium channel